MLTLFLGAGVLWVSLRVKTTLVADADGAAIVGLAVGTNLKQVAVLRHLTVLSDVEMVADGAEATRLMVAQHLLNAIVAVLAGGGAVYYYPPDGRDIIHKQPRLMFRQQVTLREDLVPRERNGEVFGKHNFNVECGVRSEERE